MLIVADVETHRYSPFLPPGDYFWQSYEENHVQKNFQAIHNTILETAKSRIVPGICINSGSSIPSKSSHPENLRTCMRTWEYNYFTLEIKKVYRLLQYYIFYSLFTWYADTRRGLSDPKQQHSLLRYAFLQLVRMGQPQKHCNILGRVPIIVYGCYDPTPASKTNHFFALLISRPSSCVRPEYV